MASIQHKDLTAGKIHIVCNYSYANAAARLAATGFVSGDVGKFAHQTDNNTIWILTATTPTWVQVTDVTGPSSATDNAVTRFDGTGGKTIQNSSVLIDDTGGISGPSFVEVAEIAAPSTPGSGKVRLYAKADGNLYQKDDAGTETGLASTGNIGGSTGSTDNRAIRADGTGGATIQSSNLTIDDTGNVSTPGYVEMAEISAPSTPASGFVRLYAKSDGSLYQKDDAGTETGLAGGGGGGGTSIDWKDSVRAATTSNGTLATAYENGDNIDGVTLATGDRILLKNQTTGSENGIYTVNASGAPTRATDADASAEVTAGMAVFVSEGTINGNTAWWLTTNDTITLGSTSLVFAQVGSYLTSQVSVKPTLGLDDPAMIIEAQNGVTLSAINFERWGTTDKAVVFGFGNESSSSPFVNKGMLNTHFYDFIFGTENTERARLKNSGVWTFTSPLAFVSNSPSQITSDQNNYNPGSNKVFIRVSTDAARTLTGFALSTTVEDGQFHIITNIGSFNLILAHQSSSSTSTNRFLCQGSVDMTFAPTESAWIQYDSTTQRWRVSRLGESSTTGSSWSALTAPGGNLTLNHGTNTTVFNFDTGTSTNNLFTLDVDASANGTGDVLKINTGASATLKPFHVVAAGTEAQFINASGNTLFGSTTASNSNSKVEINGSATDGSGNSALRVIASGSQGTGVTLENASHTFSVINRNNGKLGLYHHTNNYSFQTSYTASETGEFIGSHVNGVQMNLSSQASGGRNYSLDSTANSHSVGGGFLAITDQTAGATRARLNSSGTWYIGVPSLATSATQGFVNLPTTSGQPSGTPATIVTGFGPLVLENDTTNGRYNLWGYLNSGWRNLSASSSNVLDFPIDSPPATANAADEEFLVDNGSAWPAGFTKNESTGGYLTSSVSQGAGLLSVSTASANTLQHWYKALPSAGTDFTYRCRLSLIGNTPATSTYGGFVLHDSTGGKMEAFMFRQHPTSTQYMGMVVGKWDSISSFNALYTSPGEEAIYTQGHMVYYEVKRVGTTLSFSYSPDGRAWVLHRSHSETGFMANAPTRIGLFISSTTITNHYVVYDWFRRIV